MMTSVRIVRPIIETPPSMPETNGDHSCHGDDRRQNSAIVSSQQEERDAFEHRVCAMTDTISVSPRMKSIVSA